MRKEIITAIDRDGIEVRIHSLVFNIYKEKINLIDTIKGAVASYINSGYGFREYENNCYKSQNGADRDNGRRPQKPPCPDQERNFHDPEI